MRYYTIKLNAFGKEERLVARFSKLIPQEEIKAIVAGIYLNYVSADTLSNVLSQGDFEDEGDDAVEVEFDTDVQEMSWTSYQDCMFDYRHWVLFYEIGNAAANEPYIRIYREVDNLPEKLYYYTGLEVGEQEVNSPFTIFHTEDRDDDTIESMLDAFADCVSQHKRVFRTQGVDMAAGIFYVQEVDEDDYIEFMREMTVDL